MNLTALGLSVMCQILRGGNGYGFTRCSAGDWGIFGTYVFLMMCLIVLAVWVVRRD